VLVSQNGLTGLHDQLETTVHRVLGLFLHSARKESVELETTTNTQKNNNTIIDRQCCTCVHGLIQLVPRASP
jgi:hypothetical protein